MNIETLMKWVRILSEIQYHKKMGIENEYSK